MAPRQLTREQRAELDNALNQLGLCEPPHVEVFERRRSAREGDGLFARVNVRSGTRMLVEAPLFWISNTDQIAQRAGGHPQFPELHCPPVSPTQTAVQRRFEANCFQMGYHGRGNSAVVKKGVFLQASRFNHSCLPNAHFDWDKERAGDNDGRLTVYAIHDIEIDEEILINYGSVEDYLKSRAVRQREFSDVYGFQCTCQACRQGQQFSTQSDQRRTRLRTLVPRIIRNRNFNTTSTSQGEQQFSNIMVVHDCLVANGTTYPQQADNYRELVTWYERRLTQAQGVSDAWSSTVRAEAVAIARKSLHLDIICTGFESPGVTETLDLIAHVKQL